MSNPRILAIIPARGGSKRIPRKNIKPFCGEPIIKYSIEAAKTAGCFDEIMVSTDDREIAEIAESFGAKIPFLRSAENADDFAGVAEVVIEVLEEYKKLGQEFEYVVCIYATAPLIDAGRLREAVQILQEKDADSILPITRFGYPIQRALRVKDGLTKMFKPENYSVRSQDLEPAFHDSAQFWCMKVQSLLEQKRVFAEKTAYIEVPEFEAQDIDTEEDWKIAEFKFRILNQEG